MALRGFGSQSVTTAVPAFGTTLSSASPAPTPDRHTGQTDPRSNPSTVVLAITANIFRVGDRVGVGTAANWGAAPTTTPDWGIVTAVNTGSSQITVQGLQRAHASGEFVVLGMDAAIIIIQPTAAGPVFIGPDSSITSAPSANAAYAATNTLPYVIGQSSDGNVHQTSNYWLAAASGTATISGLETI